MLRASFTAPARVPTNSRPFTPPSQTSLAIRTAATPPRRTTGTRATLSSAADESSLTRGWEISLGVANAITESEDSITVRNAGAEASGIATGSAGTFSPCTVHMRSRRNETPSTQSKPARPENKSAASKRAEVQSSSAAASLNRRAARLKPLITREAVSSLLPAVPPVLKLPV